MEINEAIKKVDNKASFSSNEGLKFDVVIKNWRTNYGKIHFYIMPLAGSGYKWVSEDRLKFEN